MCYHLNKYDVKDIAMKQLEIEGGGTNEFSRIRQDFIDMYEQQFDDTMEINSGDGYGLMTSLVLKSPKVTNR